ncbi:hypothetical protein [Corynebacterium stationis]|uniref:PH domain-containing protein n=1 Tax=Corynebacterium stationis TaxID=1705 RepID=A0AB36CN25_9CORY|nr:hypothetical protein [Corynebacterium stationis]NME90089.1 hypothetical protein [Corynebacterium stationis]
MPLAGMHFHSRVFGFNTPRYVILAVLVVITAYFYWNGDVGTAIILTAVWLVIGAFNIAVDANKQRLRISALWIPLKTFALADIKEIELLTDTVFPERASLGINIVNGAWSYHAGPATMQINTHDGRRIRVSAQNPEALLNLVDNRFPSSPVAFQT